MPLAWIWRSCGCLSLLHKILGQWCVHILKDFFLVINCYWSLLFLFNWSRFTSQWLVKKSGNVCPNNHLDGFIIEWNLSWIPFHWRDNCKSLCKQESLTFLLYKQGRIQRLCWREFSRISTRLPNPRLPNTILPSPFCRIPYCQLLLKMTKFHNIIFYLNKNIDDVYIFYWKQ